MFKNAKKVEDSPPINYKINFGKTDINNNVDQLSPHLQHLHKGSPNNPPKNNPQSNHIPTPQP